MDYSTLKPKNYAFISMLMTLIAVIFLFIMCSTLIHSTKVFRSNFYTVELTCE